MTIKFTDRFSAPDRSTMLTNPLLLLGTASALLGSTSAQALDAGALPQGGTVTGGSATVATSGNILTVNQSSNRAIIDWRSFDIGANAQANFNQPGASAIAVNRVNGSTDPSRIEGGLRANGQVWILNPNGVMFGKSARVDAAGVVATTANIDDKAFMAGGNRLQMTGGDSGQVVNDGRITVGQGGLAAFVAPSVRNSGVIRARLGKVTLAAGDTYTLDLAGDHLVELGLGAGHAVVDQSGKVVNPGGTIEITAKAASQVVDSLVNVSGTTSASSVKTAGGQIILEGDDIDVASTAKTSADGTSGGQITAVAGKTGNYAGAYSAQGTNGDGGRVETSGKTVQIDDKIAVNTKSAKGKSGNWTLDPDNLTVITGGGALSGSTNTDSQSTIDPGTVVSALNSTDVTLQARNSITVNSAIDASGNASAHALTLADENADNSLTINLNAAITLKSGATLSGQASVVNLTNGALIQNANDVALANATITLAGGTYAAGATLNRNGLTLTGTNGALISVNNGQTGVTINANNVTASNLNIVGPLSAAYTAIDWTSQPNSWGIQVTSPTVSGFSITGNNIHDIRTGVLIANSGNPASGAASGQITGNVFNNTKGGVIDQYRDGSSVTISGNSQGAIGNEWGVVYNTNLNISNTGNATTPSLYANTPDSSRQAFLLNVASQNNGLTVLDRGYASANRTAVNVDASATGTPDNGYGNPRQALSTITAGIGAVVAGGTVNVNPGTYHESVTVDKAGLILRSVTPDGAIIDAGGGQYGITIASTAGNLGTITIDGFTVQNWSTDGIYQGMPAGPYAAMLVRNNLVYGPAGGASAHGNGIEVSGDNSVVSGNSVFNTYLNSPSWSGSGIIVVNGSHVTVQNNSVNGADIGISVTNWNNTAGMSDITIRGNTVLHASEGISIQAFEGEGVGGVASGPIASVAITGNTLTNNQTGLDIWDYSIGGRAAWATTLTSVSGNSFSANNDQISTNFTSASLTPLLAINSFDRTVVNATDADNIYGDLQTAINNAAVGSSLSLAGTFSAGVNVNKNGITINGNGTAVMDVPDQAQIDGIDVNANNVTIEGLEIAGPVTSSYLTYAWGGNISRGIAVHNGYTGFNITGNNIHDVRNGILVDGRNTGSITGNVIDNSKSAISIQYTDGTGISISGNSQGRYGNEWGVNLHLNGHYDSSNVYHSNSDKIAANAPASVQSALLALSAANNGWQTQDQGYSNFNRTAVTISTTGSDANQGSPLATLASIGAGLQAIVAGGTVNVSSGTYAEDVSIAAPRIVNFGDVTVNSLSVLTSGGGSTLSGHLAARSVNAAGNINLGGDLSIDTSAANGAITLANLDGAHQLTLDAGSGVVQMGNLGGTARLGGVDVTAGNILLGPTNKAASFDFNGDVTLSAASTLIDTVLSNSAAGGIAFAGNIFGTLDGGQSLTLNAGSGTANSTANGDVVMNNAGTSAVRLGSLSVSGRNFTALTVDVKGDFNSTLTGNQVFAADTLNAGGNVNSTVGGDVSGHIVAIGNIAMTAVGNMSGTISGDGVSLTAGQNMSGTISGNAVDLTAGQNLSGALSGNSITLAAGQNVSGTVSGSAVSVTAGQSVSGTIAGQNVVLKAGNNVSGTISGQTVSLTGRTINTQVTATTLNLNAQSGTVTGSFTQGTVSNGLTVNGQVTGGDTGPSTGGSNTGGGSAPSGGTSDTGGNNGGNTGGNTGTPQLYLNGQQLVVQNFALPAGSQIDAEGQLILPAGMMIGLLSPGGGPASLILVSDVRSLGQLLSEGYAAIVIDLKGKKPAPVKLASN